MASIGSADLLIVPKFDGLSSKVNSALGDVDTSSSGKKMGEGVSNGVGVGLGGLAKGGAIAGAFSAVASRAMDEVASHVGDAAARLDTLKNYPRVMQSLGVGADESSSSIKTMSDRLSDLPTRLDTMASTTQGLYAATKDYGVSLTKATNAGLGLNDMLLAGGQGTQVAGAAMEQFRQMLSKGKPDMQDWKSLLSAAPGQMDQLAKSMLGPTANATQLYYALGGGNEKEAAKQGFDYATISMSQLLDAIIKVDQQGGNGLASFKSQAIDATGGVQTAMDNLSNAFTKGIANVMDSVGRENIVAGINLLKTGVNDFFNVVAAGAGPLSHWVEHLDDGAIATVRINDAMQLASGPVQTVTGGFNTLGETVENAMDKAVQSEQRARDAHDEYLTQLNKSADAIQQAYGSYETQISSLEYAGQVIDTYAGKTGLSSAQQRELKDAIDTVNSACGTQYQVTGENNQIIDANTGEVEDNTKKIWENIHAREAAAKADFYGNAKQQADQTAAAAVNDFQAQKQATADAANAVQALIDKYGSYQELHKVMQETNSRGMPTAEANQANAAVEALDKQAESLKNADQAQRQAAQSSKELQAEQEALIAKSQGADLTISQLAMTTDVAAQAFNEGGSKAKYSIEDFGSALEAAASNKDALKDAMGDPNKMAEIVAAYDGSASSLESILNQLGIGFDDAAAKAADSQGTVAQMGDWLSGLGDDAYSAFALMGTSSDELAAKLSGAGVSMETLNSIGAENFSALAQTAGGSVDELVGLIQIYNQTPIVDKNGNVTANTTELTDAQGNIYVWNGTDLINKATNAKVDDATVVDAQGHKIVWNHGEFKSYNASAKVDSNALQATQGITNYNNNPPRDFHATTIIDVIHNTFENIVKTVTGQNARGGIKRHADGGVALHASGYIANRATWLDAHNIVGEDGAEAIIPLTNRQYTRPFASTVAEEVIGMLHGGSGGGAPTYVINVDGATLNDDARMREVSIDFMTELMRRADMYA